MRTSEVVMDAVVEIVVLLAKQVNEVVELALGEQLAVEAVLVSLDWRRTREFKLVLLKMVAALGAAAEGHVGHAANHHVNVALVHFRKELALPALMSNQVAYDFLS